MLYCTARCHLFWACTLRHLNFLISHNKTLRHQSLHLVFGSFSLLTLSQNDLTTMDPASIDPIPHALTCQETLLRCHEQQLNNLAENSTTFSSQIASFCNQVSALIHNYIHNCPSFYLTSLQYLLHFSSISSSLTWDPFLTRTSYSCARIIHWGS